MIINYLLIITDVYTGAEKGHWSDLTGSEFMALLVSVFSLLFVVKTSCTEWGQTYLLQERGVQRHIAVSHSTAMEVGGFIGTLTLGATTDFLIRKGYYFGSGKSPRMIAVQLCVAGSCIFFNVFLFGADPDTSKVSLHTFYTTELPTCYCNAKINLLHNTI